MRVVIDVKLFTKDHPERDDGLALSGGSRACFIFLQAIALLKAIINIDLESRFDYYLCLLIIFKIRMVLWINY